MSWHDLGLNWSKIGECDNVEIHRSNVQSRFHRKVIAVCNLSVSNETWDSSVCNVMHINVGIVLNNGIKK